MKRFLSMITTMILVLNIFCITNLDTLGFVANAEEPINAIPNPVDLTSRDDFAIGINVHSALYAAYPEEYLAEQIHAVARMGSKWIRLNGQLIREGDWSYLDTAVGLCNKYGLKIVMVLDIDRSISLEYITLLCETYARRYNGEEGRGYVDYFQLWNELDITLLRAKYGGSSPGGESEEHYYTVPVDGAADLPEYLEYFQAAEKGIHSKDSNSKFMINFSATHCGMVSYFLRNGVKFDMIGWDLYANRPYDRAISASELTKDYDLIQEKIYDTYGVPVILCETNVNTHKLTEEDCLKSDFGMDIYQIAIDNLYLAFNRPWIKGAIMYELLDEPTRGLGKPESCYGLIYNPTGGSGVLDTANEKSIYVELQKMLGGNRNLPMIMRDEIDLKPYEKLIVGTADDSNIGKDEDSDNSSDITNSEDTSTSSDITSNDSNNTSSDVTSSRPANSSSNVTSSKPANSSSDVTSSKPTNSSSDVTSSKPTNSSSDVTSSKPTNSSSDVTSSKPANSSSDVTSSKTENIISEVTSSEETNNSSNIIGSVNTDSSSDLTSSEENFSDFNSETNNLVDNNLVTDGTVSQEIVTEEVIVENIITPVKNLKEKQTSYKMPWGFIIGMSIGLFVLAGGAIAVYFIILKKKGLFK